MEQVDKGKITHVNKTRLYLISKLEVLARQTEKPIYHCLFILHERYSEKTTASKEKIHQTVFESSSIRYLSFLLPMADGYYRVCQLSSPR